MLGGPLGTLLGGALGHGFDRGLSLSGGFERLDRSGRERTQMAFFTATFSVMGHMTKADGRISEQEISPGRIRDRPARSVPDMRRMAIRLFTEGKMPGFSLDEILAQL